MPKFVRLLISFSFHDFHIVPPSIPRLILNPFDDISVEHDHNHLNILLSAHFIRLDWFL